MKYSISKLVMEKKRENPDGEMEQCEGVYMDIIFRKKK